MWRASLVALVLVGLAQLTGVAGADALDDAVRRIGLQLQCPVCEGQNVAESGSGLAQDMRAVIRAQVIEGRTDREILDGFVASYGDGILTEPPKRGIALGVWLGPLIAVPLGAVLLAVLLRQWRRNAVPAAAVVPPDAAVADEMRRFREEYG